MSDLIYKPEKTEFDVNELLQEHKKLLYSILTDMQQLNNADAESAAWEGLWDAIGTFDVYSTTTFATYAYPVIRNRIKSVLRRQTIMYKRDAASIIDIDEENTYTEDDYYSKETIDSIQKCFAEYVSSKKGITKNVLLFWYSSDFQSPIATIAKVCNCSPSYVSRVQTGFRAFLSGRLKRR